MPEKRRRRDTRQGEGRHPRDTPGAEKVYYSVQDRADRARLAGGGDPWPSGLPRAVLGLGFYCWSRRGQADRYRRLLLADGARDVQIVRYGIRRTDLKALHTLDLTTFSDRELDAWMDAHSEYTLHPPARLHDFEHVIRETGNVGQEHHFSPEAFRRFFRHLLD